jgi:hypothetical protein
MQFVSSELLDDSTCSVRGLWAGRVRAFADSHIVKPGAQTNVLSFGDFSLHGHCAAGAARTAKLAE